MKKKKSLISIVIVLLILALLVGLAYHFFVANDKDIETKETTKKEDKKETKEETITITFDVDGGKEVKELTVKIDEEVELPDTEKEGYTFKGWYLDDKKVDTKTSFKKDTSLKAKWEKVEEKKKEEPKKEEPKKEEKKVTYSCPEGYKLEGTKCIHTIAAKTKCPDGTKVDGDKCVKTSDNNSGTRTCPTRTVQTTKSHTETVQGEYYQPKGGPGYCGYYVYTNLTTQSDCNAAYDKNTVWANGKCYAKTIINDYTTTCGSGYEWYSSEQLSAKFGIHDNGKCLRIVDKTSYCDAEGYTLSGSNCVKTIDATKN